MTWWAQVSRDGDGVVTPAFPRCGKLTRGSTRYINPFHSARISISISITIVLSLHTTYSIS